MPQSDPPDTDPAESPRAGLRLISVAAMSPSERSDAAGGAPPATRGGKPVQVEFRSRVDAALGALEGYPGAPRSLSQLADDAGASLPNLLSALSLRRTMTANALKRIHRALKLDSLGLDLAVWDDAASDPARLAAAIAEKRRGDPVEIVRPHATVDPFLAVAAAGRGGAEGGAFMGVRPGRATAEEPRGGLIVRPGQSLEIRVRPPVSGFLKLICREGGDYFALDEHLGLLRRRFHADQEIAIDSRIDVDAGYYGETVLIGLVSAAAFDSEWPRGHSDPQLADRDRCADLLRRFFEGPDDARGACVVSLWTLPEQASPLEG